MVINLKETEGIINAPAAREFCGRLICALEGKHYNKDKPMKGRSSFVENSILEFYRQFSLTFVGVGHLLNDKTKTSLSVVIGGTLGLSLFIFNTKTNPLNKSPKKTTHIYSILLYTLIIVYLNKINKPIDEELVFEFSPPILQKQISVFSIKNIRINQIMRVFCMYFFITLLISIIFRILKAVFLILAIIIVYCFIVGDFGNIVFIDWKGSSITSISLQPKEIVANIKKSIYGTIKLGYKFFKGIVSFKPSKEKSENRMVVDD